MIAGKLAELAAKRAMSGFIKSRLGPLRAFNKFASWGYLMPRSYFSKLYGKAKGIERASANLLAMKPNKHIPRSLMTTAKIRAGTKYVYYVEGDLYTPEGVFFRSRYTGIATDELLRRDHAEAVGQKRLEVDTDESTVWEVKNPRLTKVLTQQ